LIGRSKSWLPSAGQSQLFEKPPVDRRAIQVDDPDKTAHEKLVQQGPIAR
jgi:hypothetical protein